MEMVPRTITSILDEIKKSESLSEDDESEFRLVLEEALTNAIQHGNDYDTSLQVQIKITLENFLLTITVSDQGVGFDYNALPNPLWEEKQLKTSGRGIFLIKKIADEVKFNSSGSEITIIKKLGKVNQNK